jgi:prepilin-type N-terminal cleavage/methylation domain-containing protein
MMPRRPGFTLIEQLVALALILIIGAAAVPQVIAAVDRARIDRAADSLRGMVEATTAFNRDVKAHNTLTPFPGKLTHLTTQIPAVSGAELTICGAQYDAGHAARWQGPYLDRVIPPGGLPVGIGTVRNELSAITASGGTMLTFVIDDVSAEDALALNARVDGDEGDPESARLGGTVRWTEPDLEGKVTLHYLRPVPTCP